MTETNKNLIKDNLFKIFENFNNRTDDYIGVMYANLYKKLSHYYKLYYDDDKEFKYIDGTVGFNTIKHSIRNKVDSRKFIQNIAKDSDKIGVDIFCYSPYEYFVIGTRDVHFLMNITLNDEPDIANLFEDVFCSTEDIDKVFDLIKGYFEISSKNEQLTFGIAAIDASNNVYTSWYDYDLTKDINIDRNYNDDFRKPYDKICSLINTSEESGLVLLYGEPGTGKSSVIKKLIVEYPAVDFVFIDGSLLASASQEKLMSYFLENQNTVFILEDCEKVLMSRDKGYNGIINTILNITDGIIGDVLGIKLICTFNTALSNIDKALLRKGRLSVKYEFGKLSAEKTSNILGYEVKTPMTLADIYNIDEENDYSKNAANRIGF